MNAPLPLDFLRAAEARSRTRHASDYIDALIAAERLEPRLNRALADVRGDRGAPVAEAVLYIAEAIAALQESGPYTDITRDAIADLRVIAVDLASTLGRGGRA